MGEIDAAPRDDELFGFMRDFRRFVEVALQRFGDDESDGESLRQAVSGHLGIGARGLPVVSEVVPPHRVVDADIALAALAGEDPGARIVGVAGDMRHHMTFGDLLQVGGPWGGGVRVGQVDYAQLPTGPGPEDRRQVVSSGVHLFHLDGTPVVVRVQGVAPQYGREDALVEVVAPERSVAEAVIDRVRALMDERSVLRGQIITFASDPYGRGMAGITFVERPSLSAEDVVLPDGVLDRIRAHVVGIGEQREHLRVHGQHLKRGVLLYGAPGTGKTHTVRHLLSSTPGTTAVLLSGGSLEHIHSAAKVARAHQPAIVVLEDCDLIAEDRSFAIGPQPLLFEVLDTLDGLDADADVAFLLTTNRVADLEIALAQRPGRVDLAVEIPLPDEVGRLALYRLYAAQLFTEDALAAAAARSEGTPASFAKELVRRAVLHAALAGTAPSDEHLAAALDQLLSDSEVLTRSLLGVAGDAGWSGEEGGFDEGGPGERGPGGPDERGEPGAGSAMLGPGPVPRPGRMPGVYRGGRGVGWFAYAPRAGGRPRA
ncbi:MAG: ATP-binding protein [Intrasporangium sp.]|uniref:AAA family ATPase n=1 Tax=Intrasporangium sp. TaxID=1925024 RepID=UPI002649E0B7|nr:ATP-binding protein [Intrasporangium sp.]MDN5796774.1 ATP-binding protein [Intrasporangium sp.]